MDSLFQYLANNQAITIILLSAIIVIIFILLGIVLDAYVKRTTSLFVVDQD